MTKQDVQVTTSEAAEALGMKASTITTWIHRGKLTSTKPQGVHVVSLREVALLKEKMGVFGGPKETSNPITLAATQKPTPTASPASPTLPLTERIALLEWAIAYGTPADLATIRENIQDRQRHKLKTYL